MGVDAEMVVRTAYAPTEEEAARWSHGLCSTVGREHFFHLDPDSAASRTKDGSQPLRPYHTLEIMEATDPDLVALSPAAGETFLRVNSMMRYYGPGYERGNVLVILASACWLEAHIPKAKIWYGGDSPRYPMGPFGPDERAELWEYYLKHGHAPYRKSTTTAPVVTCDFCGGAEMVPCSFGGAEINYICHGCGLKTVADVVTGKTVSAWGLPEGRWPQI